MKECNKVKTVFLVLLWNVFSHLMNKSYKIDFNTFISVKKWYLNVGVNSYCMSFCDFWFHFELLWLMSAISLQGGTALLEFLCQNADVPSNTKSLHVVREMMSSPSFFRRILIMGLWKMSWLALSDCLLTLFIVQIIHDIFL